MFENELPRPIFEACVETVDQALLAAQNGAHRIELCTNLEVGGTTPNQQTIHQVRETISLTVMVLVRPRAGNFVYTEEEMQEMEDSISFCKQAGVEGVVFGCLDAQGRVDVEKVERLVRCALPLQVTFHKAIDASADPLQSLQVLKSIEGITRVLTSGGAPTAHEGMEVLKKMLQMAGEQISILVAGKVTFENLDLLHRELGAREYHGRRIVC